MNNFQFLIMISFISIVITSQISIHSFLSKKYFPNYATFILFIFEQQVRVVLYVLNAEIYPFHPIFFGVRVIVSEGGLIQLFSLANGNTVKVVKYLPTELQLWPGITINKCL